MLNGLLAAIPHAYPTHHQDGAYYVHVFTSSRTMYQHHGKRIDPTTRFKLEVPDRRCLSWHYKQCV